MRVHILKHTNNVKRIKEVNDIPLKLDLFGMADKRSSGIIDDFDLSKETHYCPYCVGGGRGLKCGWGMRGGGKGGCTTHSKRIISK